MFLVKNRKAKVLIFLGPVAGGFLYDAITFRWAIFMVRFISILYLESDSILVDFQIFSLKGCHCGAAFPGLNCSIHRLFLLLEVDQCFL